VIAPCQLSPDIAHSLGSTPPHGFNTLGRRCCSKKVQRLNQFVQFGIVNLPGNLRLRSTALIFFRHSHQFSGDLWMR
jgi:hypothetical protein